MTANTTTTDKPSRRTRMLGFGALTCIACCTGPFLAALGAIGIAATASTIIAGTAVLLVLTAAVRLIPRLRRHLHSPMLLRRHQRSRTWAPAAIGQQASPY